ncbi:MAG: dTDP-4-dehydrorhamnose 3,5-epimerase [bacterium]|nr:dTDP-4-dehydrorhamnose 3,5-epimerase [bacterium]
MKFISLAIPDVLLIEPVRHGDARGFFFESYRADLFSQHGITLRFVQDNISSSVRHVVRGLHYQLDPHAQGKLVRVVRGVVFDVAVDVRRGSPTFGRWVGAELSEENCLAMYVPPGFAHGFCVLSDLAVFHYKCTAYYAPAYERTIKWDDPAIGIAWPVSRAEAVLSAKDAVAPVLAEAEINYVFSPAR